MSKKDEYGTGESSILIVDFQPIVREGLVSHRPTASRWVISKKKLSSCFFSTHPLIYKEYAPAVKADRALVHTMPDC